MVLKNGKRCRRRRRFFARNHNDDNKSIPIDLNANNKTTQNFFFWHQLNKCIGEDRSYFRSCQTFNSNQMEMEKKNGFCGWESHILKMLCTKFNVLKLNTNLFIKKEKFGIRCDNSCIYLIKFYSHFRLQIRLASKHSQTFCIINWCRWWLCILSQRIPPNSSWLFWWKFS